MKMILLFGFFILALHAKPLPTELPSTLLIEEYESILRYDPLFFDGGSLTEASQKEFQKIVHNIRNLQKKNKQYELVIVGYDYNSSEYYPKKNRINLNYKIENSTKVDDQSSYYAEAVARKFKAEQIPQEKIKLYAKSGYHLLFSDETGSSAKLSQRVSVALYILEPNDIDSDRDGVFDRYDRCKATPRGAKVDKNGCPVDSDKDGVVDYKDKCPNTEPIGIIVDKYGCPLDSDEDGVIDYKDKCVNTPKGMDVDLHGCPPKQTLKLYFQRNSAKILKMSEPEIEKFAKFLKENPKYKVHIIGHTDSRGQAGKNMKLSLARAKNVKKALVLEGIDADRISVSGRGELEPVTTNRTAEGRAKNRRIEVELFL